MAILRLGKEDARVSSHLRALSGKWTVIFWPEVFKIFILKSGDIFARRVSSSPNSNFKTKFTTKANNAFLNCHPVTRNSCCV